MPAIQDNIIWLKAGYAFGALVPVSAFFWVLILCNKKISKKWSLSLSLLALIFFIASLTDELVVSKVTKVYVGGYQGSFGPLFPAYSIFMTMIVGLLIYTLLKSYIKSGGLLKTQLSYALLGAILWGGTSVIVSFIFPLIGLMIFVPLDSITVTSFLVLTALAITRYHLFEVKVILTEILIIAMGLVLIFLPFSMPTVTLRFLTTAVLFLFLIFGFLLIQATHNEVRRKEEAERLLKAKTEFLSIASHQLRTPLTSMIGYSSMLKEGSYGKLPEKASGAIEHIYDSSRRMIEMVNDFLNVSRLETKKTVLRKKEVSLKDLINRVVAELSFKAQEKNLYLKYEQPKIDKIIKIDSEKLKEAVSNLIDNSIHYTKKGGITVDAKADDSKIFITVSDTGAGMAQGELVKIFESFSRGSAGNELNTQGSGLGLYIAKKFVEMHNGKIWAESKGKNKGSAFHIELPNKY
jgi:signal transduction histidine kinase